MGASSQHPPDLLTLAPNSWDRHAVVSGRLVPHPRDQRSLGSLHDRNALRPGDGAAPDRRCMIGDSSCHPVGEISVIRMKAQERKHRPKKVLDILSLGLLPASGVGLLAFRKSFRGPFGLQFGTNLFDGRCRCLHAF